MQTTKKELKGKRRVLILAFFGALILANAQPVFAQKTYQTHSLAETFGDSVNFLVGIADNGTFLGYAQGSTALITRSSIQPLDAPSGPFDPSSASYTAINASLAAAGSIYLDDYSDSAVFVRQAAGNFRFLSLPLPVGSSPYPTGINANGDVVGSYYDENFLLQGFISDGNGFHEIEVPGATDVEPAGINASGAIVGSYLDENYDSHAFVMDNKGATEVTIPGATYVSANCVNDNGEIGGGYFDGTNSHGFVLKGGKITNIDYSNPNAPDSITNKFGVVYVKFASSPTVTGINARGDVVGYTFDIYKPVDPNNHHLLGFQNSFWGTRLP